MTTTSWRGVPKSGCATAKTPPHNQTDPLPTAAVRDFDPAYVRFGSITSDMIERAQRPMAALPQKRTNGQTSRYVRNVPKATWVCWC
jgi:hypothetical protein